MKISSGGAGATVYNLNSLIEWNNISELEQILFGGDDEEGFARRAFGIEVRIFYLLLAEKHIDDLSEDLINLALDERLTALVSLLPFEAAALGGYLDVDDETPQKLTAGIDSYLRGRRRSFEEALNEVHRMDEDDVLALLFYLEAKGITTLKALTPMFISRIFVSELFDFDEFFRLMAAGVPLGILDMVETSDIEASIP